MILETQKLSSIKLVLGELGTNGYLIRCITTGKGILIDPAGNETRILEQIEKREIDLQAIILTHAHFDHIMAVPEVKKQTCAPLMIHSGDAGMLSDPTKNLSAYFGAPLLLDPPDQELADNDTIDCGSLTFKVIHTPGHSPGGITLQVDTHLYTGDALFAGSIGRTDFPGADADTLIRSIKEKILTFPDDYVVLPGHGENTTVGAEKTENPFL